MDGRIGFESVTLLGLYYAGIAMVLVAEWIAGGSPRLVAVVLSWW